MAAPVERRGRVTPEDLEAALARMMVNVPGAATGSSAGLDADRFFAVDYSGVLAGLIAEIVEADGPIPLPVLCRMVAARHGWQRTGHRIAARVSECLALVSVVDEFGIPFVWPKDAEADRIPFSGMRGRALRDISRTEIASLIDARRGSLEASPDAVAEIGRALSISRLTTEARAYIDACRKWAEETRV